MEERNRWHESQINITSNKKFIEDLYDFNVFFSKLTEKKLDEINSKDEDELEQLNQVCLYLLNSFLSIAIQESDNKSYFRNWLVWNQDLIHGYFSGLNIDKTAHNQLEFFNNVKEKIEISQYFPQDSQFYGTYHEYARAIDFLKSGRGKQNIIGNSVNRFFSLIDTIIEKEYFRFYEKNKKDFRNDFELIKKVLHSHGKDTREIEEEWKKRKLIMSTEIDLQNIQTKAIYNAFESLIIERKKGILQKLIEALNKKINEIKAELKLVLDNAISFKNHIKDIFTDPQYTLNTIKVAIHNPDKAFKTIWSWIKENPVKTAVFSVFGLAIVAGVVMGAIYLAPAVASSIAVGASVMASNATAVGVAVATGTVIGGSVLLAAGIPVGGIVLTSGVGKEIIEVTKAEEEINRENEKIEELKTSIEHEYEKKIRHIKDKELEEAEVRVARAKARSEAAERNVKLTSNLNNNMLPEVREAQSKLNQEFSDLSSMLSSSYEKKGKLCNEQEKINKSMSKNKDNESKLHEVRDSMKKESKKFSFFKPKEYDSDFDSDMYDHNNTIHNTTQKFK